MVISGPSICPINIYFFDVFLWDMWEFPNKGHYIHLLFFVRYRRNLVQWSLIFGNDFVANCKSQSPSLPLSLSFSVVTDQKPIFHSTYVILNFHKWLQIMFRDLRLRRFPFGRLARNPLRLNPKRFPRIFFPTEYAPSPWVGGIDLSVPVRSNVKLVLMDSRRRARKEFGDTVDQLISCSGFFFRAPPPPWEEVRPSGRVYPVCQAGPSP